MIVEFKRTEEKSKQTEGEVTNDPKIFKAILDNLTMLNNKVENNSKLLEKLVPEKKFSFIKENLFDDHGFNESKVSPSPSSNPPIMSPIDTRPFIDSI